MKVGSWTFRWPWVARSAHEAVVAAKDVLLSGLISELAVARSERAALLDRLLAREAPAPVTITPRARREHDAADTAIDFVARGDHVKRRHLERYAKSERAKGTDAEAIAAAILHPPAESDDEGV